MAMASGYGYCYGYATVAMAMVVAMALAMVEQTIRIDNLSMALAMAMAPWLVNTRSYSNKEHFFNYTKNGVTRLKSYAIYIECEGLHSKPHSGLAGLT